MAAASHGWCRNLKEESSEQTADLHSDGWRFILRLYAKPGISDLCLQLQEKAEVDVNVLLFAAYAAVDRGWILDRSALQLIDAAIEDWRHRVVAPLRALRGDLKSESLSLRHPASQALRDKVKADELFAEQIEFGLIMRFLDRQKARDATPIEAIRQALRATVEFYAAKQRSSAAAESLEFESSIDEIATAAGGLI
jgi:uncharacterized protein (TIGR02444 family)